MSDAAGQLKDPPRRSGKIGPYLWGVFSAILGGVLGISIYFGYDFIHARPQGHPPEVSPIVQATDSLTFSDPHSALPTELRIDKVVIGPGRFSFPTHGIWVANSIVLSPDTVLVGDDITLVAVSVSGGRIDVSGTDGAGDKKDGAPAGTLLIASRTIDHLAIVARGGNGAPGTNGADGSNGRNGSCNGFGSYKGADRGGDGSAGGAGGNGGAGGTVRLITTQLTDVKPNVEGGSFGRAGPGGRGGLGGRGCVGLGGAQPNQPEGRSGSPGRDGQPGSEGRPILVPISYEQLVSMVRESPSASQLRTSLAALANK